MRVAPHCTLTMQVAMKTQITKLVLLALTLVTLGGFHPASAKLERENDPKDGSVSLSTEIINLDAKTHLVGLCVLIPQKGSKPLAPVSSLVIVSETPRPDWSGAPKQITISTPTQTFTAELSYSKEADNMASLQILLKTEELIHMTHCKQVSLTAGKIKITLNRPTLSALHELAETVDGEAIVHLETE